jgi:hypothetical protein
MQRERKAVVDDASSQLDSFGPGSNRQGLVGFGLLPDEVTVDVATKRSGTQILLSYSAGVKTKGSFLLAPDV